MLNLLYITLAALEQGTIDQRLIRYIFEIRIIGMNGEYPADTAVSAMEDPSAKYAVSYILSAPLNKLYTFRVSEQVLSQIEAVQERLRPRIIDMRLKSLEILMQMKP